MIPYKYKVEQVVDEAEGWRRIATYFSFELHWEKDERVKACFERTTADKETLHARILDKDNSVLSVFSDFDRRKEKLEKTAPVSNQTNTAAVEEFMLHDGEDDKKTEKLHEFLQGVEWDGDNCGITIWMNVRVGDTIQVRREADGGVVLVGVKKSVKNV